MAEVEERKIGAERRRVRWFPWLRGGSGPGWLGAWTAVLALAIWLSQLSPMWLAAVALGSALCSFSAVKSRDPVRALVVVLLWLAVGLAAGVQVRLDRIAYRWDELVPRIEEDAAEALGDALDGLVGQGEQAAASAAEAGVGMTRPELFERLEVIQRTTGVSAIALFDSSGTPLAWAGEHRGTIPPAARSGQRSYLYQEGPLFSYLYFIRALPDGATAMAAFLLEASVEAGEGIVPFADRFERRHGARPRFWTPDRARPESIWDWATETEEILSVSFASLTQQDWWLRAADTGRRATGLVGLAALLALSVAWYRARREASGLPVAATTAALLLAPVDRLIGSDVLFSPLQFVLPGRFDITLGTLLVLLLGGAVWLLTHTAQERRALIPVWIAIPVLLLLFPLTLALIDRSASDGLLAGRVAGGVFLQLATTLLIAIPLFLLFAYLSIPRVAGKVRVLSRTFGYALPALFGLGLLLWWRPDRPLPLAYAAAWALPAVLLAFAEQRGGRGGGLLRQWLVAAWLASTATLAFLWPMHLRADLGRAERELALLGTQTDPFLDYLLRQFGELADRHAAEGEGGVNLLYHSWVESRLADEGSEARLSLWRGGELEVELNLSELGPVVEPVLAEVLSVSEGVVVKYYGGVHGLHYLLVAPLADGSIASAAIPPRRNLGGTTSLARFLHREDAVVASPRPGALRMVRAEDPLPGAEEGVLARPDTVHWLRVDDGWRSETIVEMPEGPVHAHLTLALPPLPLLLTRAALLIASLLASTFLVWLLGRSICRDFSAMRLLRIHWLRSFRGRLSVALFVFFLLPTIVFGVISYRAVAQEVVRSDAALAQQALNDAASRIEDASLAQLGGMARTDLLLYQEGEIAGATVPEVLELGLFHTWLPPAVYLRFAGGEEIQQLEERRIAQSDYLVAYQRLDGRNVLAAPSPLASNEITRRQQQFRDIALLVILLGLALSIFLALLVSRALARPLEELSRAASTVGAGNLRTRLPGERSDEFGRVYESFNEMVGRLDRTRAALVQETRRTETIVAEAATGVLALDPEGRVELINPRAAEILGGRVETGDSLIPSTADEIGPLPEAVRGLLLSADPEASTELDLDGRTVRMKLRRLVADEGGGGAVIALEDVTAELRTARVLAWGEMARQVAHEIKNPLTPIKLAVQHLRRAFLDARPDFDRILDRNVDSILKEIDRLGEISRAFSRFGTPGPGNAPLEAVDVEGTIREILALYGGSSEGTRFRLELPEERLPLAVARTGELKEVLLNLLENAREAVGPRGEVVVSTHRDGAPDWLSIEVSDNGVGIPADQLPSIFEPHFSTRSSGTGLGLAIVRRIVDSWGGQITAESEAGVGSRFTIRVRASDRREGEPGEVHPLLPRHPHTLRETVRRGDPMTDLKRAEQMGQGETEGTHGMQDAAERGEGEPGGSGADRSTSGTNRDFDESGRAANQGHGHPREERRRGE